MYMKTTSQPNQAAFVPVHTAPDITAPPERVKLEIRREKLLELLRDRHLCAADFKCSDCQSKHCVWRLILVAGNARGKQWESV